MFTVVFINNYKYEAKIQIEAFIIPYHFQN